MATIRVWEGYRATCGDYVTYIVFNGEHIGGVEYRVDDCDVLYTFYRAHNGAVVVHETRSIEYGSLRAIYSHTQASVYIYETLDAACEAHNIPRQHIDPRRRNAAATRGNEYGVRTITLEQYIAEVNYV